jgi:hypothetical protein
VFIGTVAGASVVGAPPGAVAEVDEAPPHPVTNRARRSATSAKGAADLGLGFSDIDVRWYRPMGGGG